MPAGVIVGLVAFAVHSAIQAIHEWKFDIVQHYLDSRSLWTAFAVFLALNLAICLVGTLAIVFVAVSAAHYTCHGR